MKRHNYIPDIPFFILSAKYILDTISNQFLNKQYLVRKRHKMHFLNGHFNGVKLVDTCSVDNSSSQHLDNILKAFHQYRHTAWTLYSIHVHTTICLSSKWINRNSKILELVLNLNSSFFSPWNLPQYCQVHWRKSKKKIWTEIKNFMDEIKKFHGRNSKFHGRNSKISWTEIKNFMDEIQKFHGRNSKFHGRKSWPSILKWSAISFCKFALSANQHFVN